MQRVTAGSAFFVIRNGGELFSWGEGRSGLLGHGDEQDVQAARRVDALRGASQPEQPRTAPSPCSAPSVFDMFALENAFDL